MNICVFLASSDCLANHFTDECVLLCSDALKFLIDLVESLEHKKVSVQQLKALVSHSSHLVDLFSPKVTKMITDDPSFNIEDLIAKRNNEVEKFELYCSKVRILFKHCESIANGMHIIFECT